MASKGQLGIPRSIWLQPILQDYLRQGTVFGYVGAHKRSRSTDVLVIRFLRDAGLTDDEVAEWLTSTSGRHLMDDKLTVERLLGYTKNAKQEVSKWRQKENSLRLV